MRIPHLVTVALLGAVIAAPAPASAQLNIQLRFGSRLGPEIGVFAYSPERYGDWRTSYRRWTPVTLYDVNGRYYRTQVTGGRPVLVYAYNNEYFLPPQDGGWRGFDRRYNYQRAPGSDDYRRTRPYEPPYRIDPRLGAEIGVVDFSPERAGDWRRNYRRWTPVTLYEFRGRYYPNTAPGARPVAMYRFQNEYFLPPRDQAWVGFDRRFNYQYQPTQEDRGRVRVP